MAGGTALLRGIRKTEEIAGAPVSVQAGKVMDRLSAAIGKGDYAELRKLSEDPDYAWKVLNGEEILEAAARDSAKVYDDMVDTFSEVSSHTKGTKKAERMLKEVEPGNEWAALDRTYDVITQFQAALREQMANPAGIDVGALRQLHKSANYMLNSTRKHLEGLWGVKLEVDPKNAEMGWQVVTRKIVGVDEVVNGVHQRTAKRVKVYTPLEASPKVGPSPDWGSGFSARMFNQLDEFKKIAGGPAFKTVKDKKGFNTRSLLSDQYTRMQELLEDGSVWGLKAAEMQQVVNKAYSDLIRLWKEFEPNFGATVKGRRTGDIAKFRTMLKQLSGGDTPPVRPGDVPGGATMVDTAANQRRIDELTEELGGWEPSGTPVDPADRLEVQSRWDDLLAQKEEQLAKLPDDAHPDWATDLTREIEAIKGLRQSNRDPADFMEMGELLDPWAASDARLFAIKGEIDDLTAQNARAASDLDPSSEFIGPTNRTLTEETIRDKRFGETLRAYETYILAVQQQYGVKAGTETLEKLSQLKSRYRDLTETVNGMNALKEMERGGALGLGTIGTTAWIGGVPGAVAGVAIAAIANPAKALRTRAAIQGLKSKAAARRDLAIDRAVSRIVKPSKRALPGGIQYDRLGRVKEPWLKHLHFMGHIGQEKKDKKKEDKLRPVAAQARDTLNAVASLSENPERINNTVMKGLSSIDGAPNLQAAITEKVIANVQYCNENLPAGINRTTDVLTGEDKFLVTDAAAHQYMERVCTVNDWLGVLGPSLEAGVATPTMVDVAEHVDPDGFERYKTGIRNGLLAHYEKTGERPSLKMSGQLSMVLGIPISSAYAGPVIKMHQGLYQAPMEKQQLRQGRMNALKQRPKDTMTRLQEMGRA